MVGLKREIMEEFRGLLNMESTEGKMVNFIFFGLPDLDQVLMLDEPLKQRVAVRIRLSARPTAAPRPPAPSAACRSPARTTSTG